jgi:hypothetical protein
MALDKDDTQHEHELTHVTISLSSCPQPADGMEEGLRRSDESSRIVTYVHMLATQHLSCSGRMFAMFFTLTIQAAPCHNCTFNMAIYRFR